MIPSLNEVLQVPRKRSHEGDIERFGALEGVEAPDAGQADGSEQRVA